VTVRFSSALVLLLALVPSGLVVSRPAAGGAAPQAVNLSTAPDLIDSQWPASWIAVPGAPIRDAGVYHFRRTIDLPAAPERFLVHVSADNRYLLHVNGRRVGAGPARGDLEHWPYDSYDLAPFLTAGANLVAATVWNFGMDAPMAQVSRRAGFLLQGDDPAARVLDTNGSWQAEIERGRAPDPESLRELHARHFYYAASPGERLDGTAMDWQWDRPGSGGPRWTAALEIGRANPRSISKGPGWMLSPEGWLLVPNRLPPMTYEPTSPGEVVESHGAAVDRGFPRAGAARVAAHARARILLDRRTLSNAYPEFVISGGRGASVKVTYAEALYDRDGGKGNRNDLAGKQIAGMFDEIVADGGAGRRFAPLWFRTWRFVEIAVTTTDEPLTLEHVGAWFTGFPFTLGASFESDDPSLAEIFEVGWRTARLAAHETYMDAPYWEQLQYVGDTRIDALISYAMTGDDRLARRAMELFDQSRRADGITQSRYPTREPQYIPPYALFFVEMVHDHWMYVGDRRLVAARLAATRAVLDWFLARQRPDGLLGHLPFWVHGDTGTALDDAIQDPDGGSGVVTMQFLGAARRAAELEEAVGDPGRAAAYRRAADRAARGAARLWDPTHGLMADTPAHRTWSHPVNIVALLEGVVPATERDRVARRVLAIARHPAGRSASGGAGGAWPIDEIPSASYYFRFYLARAMEATGASGAYVDLLDPWRAMLAEGLTTWAEHPEPTRSDCHAWSAHPNFDLLRTVAGIRPASPGFRTVLIAPALGPLRWLSATHPHPAGEIVVRYERTGAGLKAEITLPEGVTGEFLWGGHRRPLTAGRQQFTVAGSGGDRAGP
jgi:alpha-L-rhamnosidase